jgi:uncharacterized protein YycO
MTYTIDQDALTVRDLIALQNAGNDITAQVAILRKCVIVDGDGSFEDLPARHYGAIVKAILGALTASGN